MSAIIDGLLDEYWLWKEVYLKAGITHPAYRYWVNTQHIKLNRYVFVKKNTIPKKFSHIEPLLTDLSGYLPASYAASQMGLDEHTFNFKKMSLYGHFEYKFIDGVKFVNVRRFFTEYGIPVKAGDNVFIGKIEDIIIDNKSLYYQLNERYGIVVY